MYLAKVHLELVFLCHFDVFIKTRYSGCYNIGVRN